MADRNSSTKIWGNVRAKSVTRIRTESSDPPKNPATAPMHVPITTDPPMARNPTVSEIRPP